ncbi:MAG: hypothetical protein OCC49_13495 [Fibrobacterales bacterium]
MPTDVAILSWNIKDVNKDMINDASFIAMVVKVIKNQNVHCVSILETKGNQGLNFGSKLKASLGGSWDAQESEKSAKHSNKPENYLFLWDDVTVKAPGKIFKFPITSKYIPWNIGVATKIGYPNRHDTTKKQKPSRFPFIGKFRANTTDFTCVVFHTTFASVHIAESNQNLGYIDEVNDDAHVIVMGDFNDDPNNSRSYKTIPGFKPLEDAGLTSHITAKTSLKQAFIPTWANTLDCRANVYDNAFVKGLTVKSAVVVDLVDALQHPNWLSVEGRTLFNSWATRQNTKKGASNVLFTAGENIANLEDAHETHWVAVSDHLPIKITMEVP